MALIKKFSKGDAISYNNTLKLQVQEAYNNADLATKVKMAAVALSARNYLISDKLTSKNTTLFENSINERLLNIANGGSGYNNVSVGAARANMFGKYSEAEVDNIANEVVRKTLSGLTTQSQGSSTLSTTTQTALPTAGTVGHYRFQWDNGLNSDYISDSDDLRARANTFINTLRNNILATLDAQALNKKIHGISADILSKLPLYLEALNSSDFNTQLWDILNLDTLNTKIEYLKNLAQKLNIPFADFSRYFPEWFNPTEDIVNKRGLLAKGFKFSKPIIDGVDLSDYLKLKGYNYATKDGKHYILDENWNFITTPISEIFDDASNTQLYGKGVFSNTDGEFVFGDIDNYSSGNNYWALVVTKALDDLRNRRKNVAVGYDYDYVYGVGGDLANEVRDQLNRSFSYADVSSMFSGDDLIIAIAPEGKKIEYDKFGNIKFVPGTTFWYKKNDTLVSADNIDKVKQDLNTGFSYTGYGTEKPEQAGGYRQMTVKGDSTITGDEDLMHRGFFGVAAIGGIGGVLGYSFLDNVNEDPLGFFNMMITALSNPEGDDADNVAGHDNSYIDNRSLINDFGGILNIMPYLAKLLREGDAKLSPEYASKWRALVRSYNDILSQTISSEKLGGILKAAYGQLLDYQGNEISREAYKNKNEAKIERTVKEHEAKYNIDEARKAGYDTVAEYSYNMRLPAKDFSASDMIRFAAMAADVASIPAAWVVGAGSAVSAALGAASSAATFVTDITDDGFQFRDLGSLVVNLGLSLANTVTGGASGMAKILKNLVKYGPLCYAAWSTMSNGDKYAKILDKVNGGGSLTVEDWKLLALGLALIAGANRIGASAYKQRTIKNNAQLDKLVKEGKLGKNTVKVKEGDKVVAKEITGEQAELLRNAKSLSEANTLLELFFPNSKIEAIPDKSIGWKFWKGRLNNDKNPYNKLLNAALDEANAAGLPTNEAIRLAVLTADDNQRFYSNLSDSFVNRIGQKLGLATDMDIYLSTNGLYRVTKGNGDLIAERDRYIRLLKEAARKAKAAEATEATKNLAEGSPNTNIPPVPFNKLGSALYRLKVYVNNK